MCLRCRCLKVLGPQAPRWVLEVAVLASPMQGTAFHDISQGHVVSALRSCRRLPCQRLQRESRSWAGTKLCKIRDVRSCFASVTAIGRKEDVARRCGSCTVSILMLCDGITLKIVGNFHVVPGVQYCDLGRSLTVERAGCGWPLTVQMERREDG